MDKTLEDGALIARIAAEALNNPPGDAMTRRDMILAARKLAQPSPVDNRKDASHE